MTERKLIIGLGNVLLKDEGVGVRCVEYLRERGPYPGVKLVDGATFGFDLLEEMKDFATVVLVDAVDMGKEPGHIAVISADQISILPDGEKFSLHEINLIDVIRLGKEIGHNFGNVRIVGIQPEEIAQGIGLSETIERRLPVLAEKVLRETDH